MTVAEVFNVLTPIVLRLDELNKQSIVILEEQKWLLKKLEEIQIASP